MAVPDICVIYANGEGDEDIGYVYFTITEKYTINRNAEISNYRIESKRSVTDNHSANNRRFMFSGLVTIAEVVGGGYDEVIDPATIISKLDKLIERGSIFTFITDNELGLESVDDCVLVSYEISRDATMYEAVEVSVEITSNQFITSAERSSLSQPSSDKAAQLESEKKLGQTPTKKSEETLEERLDLNLKAQKARG